MGCFPRAYGIILVHIHSRDKDTAFSNISLYYEIGITVVNAGETDRASVSTILIRRAAVPVLMKRKTPVFGYLKAETSWIIPFWASLKKLCSVTSSYPPYFPVDCTHSIGFRVPQRCRKSLRLLILPVASNTVVTQFDCNVRVQRSRAATNGPQ
jgi:hypothetical protein